MELLQVGSGALTTPAAPKTLISAGESAHTATGKVTKLKNVDLRRILRQKLQKATKAEANKKKKLRKQVMKKKKKEGGANKATVDLPGTGTVAGGDSSSSEEPSPYFETGARSKRVAFPRLGAAKRATAFCFPTLGDIHEGIEEMTEEQIREQIHKARIAKNNEASPAMQGIVSKNRQRRITEKIYSDTGAFFSYH